MQLLQKRMRFACVHWQIIFYIFFSKFMIYKLFLNKIKVNGLFCYWKQMIADDRSGKCVKLSVSVPNLFVIGAKNVA